MNTSLYGLNRLSDVAIVINHSNSTLQLPGVKEVKNISSSHDLYLLTPPACTQEGGHDSGLLPIWNVRPCDQSGE